MNSKTASISADKFSPLEVEWIDYNEKPGMGRFRIMPDGSSKRLNGKHVSLVHPGKHRARILNLDPQTALNLLAWLEQEREMLERLVHEPVE